MAAKCGQGVPDGKETKYFDLALVPAFIRVPFLPDYGRKEGFKYDFMYGYDPCYGFILCIFIIPLVRRQPRDNGATHDRVTAVGHWRLFGIPISALHTQVS